MAMLSPTMLDAVVAIGSKTENKFSWFGTGFIVARPFEEDQSRVTTYLVTNKHVLEGKSQIFIRFNDTGGSTTLDEPVDLVIDGKVKWSSHPQADVAVMPLNGNYLREKGIKYKHIHLQDTALGRQQMLDSGISEGDFLYVLGFPLGIVTEGVNHVITRLGIVAQIQQFLHQRSKSFTIDSMVFPGNSGGPVLLRPEMNAVVDTKPNSVGYLIGIVKQYIPYSETAISVQTRKPRITFEENTGLTLVESVDSIRETVELEFKRASKELNVATAQTTSKVYLGTPFKSS